MALWSDNIGESALRLDDRIGRALTVIGIPSAFLLHGYVGFIFGSIKANPWWSTPLMPIVFLFSAIVSGIACILLLYFVTCWLRRVPVDMPCVDTIAKYLYYAFLVDFSLEMLDLIHRLYEADESFRALDFMVKTRLFTSQIVVQIILGTLVPLALLAATQLFTFTERARRALYVLAGGLTMIGIFAMRWNVVIGGQLFSKSFLGYTTYKMEFATREGLLPAIVLMILPFVILWVLIRLLPPWGHGGDAPAGTPDVADRVCGTAGRPRAGTGRRVRERQARRARICHPRTAIVSRDNSRRASRRLEGQPASAGEAAPDAGRGAVQNRPRPEPPGRAGAGAIRSPCSRSSAASSSSSAGRTCSAR